MFEVALRPAHEARAIAEELTLDRARDHLTWVTDAIEHALYKGQFEARINLQGQIHPAVMRQLRNAGYDVHRSGPDGYSISWRF